MDGERKTRIGPLKWFSSDDPDVRWIMRENLGKQRLVHVDAAWVARWKAYLSNCLFHKSVLE
jgi:hypothetical protein